MVWGGVEPPTSASQFVCGLPVVSHARPRTCGEIAGLAVARGRAQAGLGSICGTADGPVAAFTYRDQLTLHGASALVQIDAESKIGQLAGRRQHPAERQRSRVCWAGVVVAVRAGAAGVSGGVLEGDFLAGQAFQLGDELAFATLRGKAVVPVRAEVGEVGGGVG